MHLVQDGFYAGEFSIRFSRVPLSRCRHVLTYYLPLQYEAVNFYDNSCGIYDESEVITVTSPNANGAGSGHYCISGPGDGGCHSQGTEYWGECLYDVWHGYGN